MVGYLDGLNEYAEKTGIDNIHILLWLLPALSVTSTHKKEELLLVDFVSEYWWMG